MRGQPLHDLRPALQPVWRQRHPQCLVAACCCHHPVVFLPLDNLQLSVDGRYVAYIKPAPTTGVSNVFIRKLPAPGDRPALSEGLEDAPSIFDRSGADAGRQITFDTRQGVSAYSWSEDSDKIYFIQDQDGDENYHLFMSSIDKPGEAINLTPFPGVKADGIISNEHFPDKLLFVSQLL